MDTTSAMAWLASDHSGSRVLRVVLLIAVVVVAVGVWATLRDIVRMLHQPPRVRRNGKQYW